jgi:hypothetical protein
MSLGAGQLTKMRTRLQSRTMTDLCTFYSPAPPDAGDKGEASADADVAGASAVPCRVGSTQQGAGEGDRGGQVRSKLRVDLFVPAGTAVPANAGYVIITSQNNRRLEISGTVIVSDKLTLKIECWEDK